ncbi:MAG: class I tRNA ligase family protein [Patescibacteria group bacterium]|nr:MAG: class I tRNA ligase family protein [Patescibacteria group bacterium]
MPKYEPRELEKKWQARWDAERVFAAKEDASKEKCYILDMFPYPSSNGLHVGHPIGYIATDILSRKRRMDGKCVLHPMGWDAFGLPAENYAIKIGGHPHDITQQSVANYIRQLKLIGFSYDWEREINTSLPSYYKWTQWMFLLLYKNGLAYKKQAPVNWCEFDHTVLANEQVVDGKCERCKNPVVQKNLSQWFFKITDFADRLLEDLDSLEWPEKIKAMQRNWIGRSEGAEIDFRGHTPDGGEFDLTVFTTRPDTLFGVSAVVVAPEHPIVERLTAEAERGAVAAYIEATKRKSEIERTGTDQAKTGVFTGAYAKHPFTGEDVPVYVADYVLPQYGTGAVMVVPAHDERDHAFAKTYGLRITTVVEPVTGTPQENPEYRRSIVALVEDPSSKKVLSINWGSSMGGHLLVGGGRDENEDPEACARREILEETGYADLELVGMSETIHHNYFAHSKNVARAIDAIGLHFRLKSDRRASTALEANEEGKFTVEWLSFEDAATKVSDPLHAYVLQKFAFDRPYTDDGILTGSGAFDGLASADARKKITAALEAEKKGRKQVNYHLRDWLVSRQRYWGAPIPIVYCDEHGEQPVPEEQLPVTLPDDVDFRPTGESPLARSKKFHDVACPKCGKPAKRESDTMDTFVDSSWYFLRYCDPKNESAFADKAKVDYWCPVDTYVGGAEHAVLHLLYARFFTKVLFDAGFVKFKEPFTRLKNQGLILGEDGEKMSKSRGNVVNPDDVIAEHGADAFRLYEMFMGDFEQVKPWSTSGIIGQRRFLERVWKMQSGAAETPAKLRSLLHKTIKKVTEDIEAFKFNTAISTMMIFVNENEGAQLSNADYEAFLKILSPFAPHITEELWEASGQKELIALAPWPAYDAALTVDSEVEIALQVTGKVKDRITVPVDADDKELERLAMENEKVKAALEGKTVKQVIVVKKRLVNIVAV